MKLSRKTWIWGAIFLALALLVKQCVPEKFLDEDTQITPISWINDTSFMVTQGGKSYLVDARMALTESADIPDPAWKKPMPEIAFAPRYPSMIRTINGQKVVVVRGQHYRVTQGAPWRGIHLRNTLPFVTYAKAGKIGLLTFEHDVARVVELPVRYSGNKSIPQVIWDEQAGLFFAFQIACGQRRQEGECVRTGWWLSPELRVVRSVLLPREDLLIVKEQLQCFSCGCGCYTREEVYAVNGIVYFHVFGFPLPASRRGLYRVTPESGGKSSWSQVVSGRMEPPLAFSPSGCKVAYFQVSYFGDELQSDEICE